MVLAPGLQGGWGTIPAQGGATPSSTISLISLWLSAGRSGLRPRPPRYGQAREISRIAAAPDFPFDPDLLRHVSPIEWKNVILYGEIKIDPSKLKMRGS